MAAPHFVGGSPHATSTRPSISPAQALYERELAFFLSDEPYLSVEKAAQRCVKLSMLLMQARVISG